MVTYVINDYGSFPTRIERVAEIIRDYDPELSLKFIPVEHRSGFDGKPFAVWHTPSDGRAAPYIVMSLREDEVDHRVIAALFEANHANNDPVAKIEAEEAAIRAMKLKEELDWREAAQDFTKWAIKSNHRVTHNGVVYE